MWPMNLSVRCRLCLLKGLQGGQGKSESLIALFALELMYTAILWQYTSYVLYRGVIWHLNTSVLFLYMPLISYRGINVCFFSWFLMKPTERNSCMLYLVLYYRANLTIIASREEWFHNILSTIWRHTECLCLCSTELQGLHEPPLSILPLVIVIRFHNNIL